MDEDMINALAREYVNETVVTSEGFSKTDYKEGLGVVADFAVLVICWLSERFCIVEKRRVQEEYDLALSNFEKTGWARPLNRSYYEGRSDAIKAIFPEI